VCLPSLHRCRPQHLAAVFAGLSVDQSVELLVHRQHQLAVAARLRGQVDHLVGVGLGGEQLVGLTRTHAASSTARLLARSRASRSLVPWS